MVISKSQIQAVALALPIALGACSGNVGRQADEHLTVADKYLADGKHAEALIEFRKAAQLQPRVGAVRLKLAEAYLKANEPAKALGEFVRAADLMPSDIDVQLKAAGRLLVAGYFEDARARAEKVLERDPKHVQAHVLVANALVGLKDMDSAIAQIEEAIALSPEQGGTYSNLGVMELARGKIDAAEQAFKRALDADGRSITAHLSLANLYWLSGRPAEAELALKRSLEIEPNNVIANRTMAALLIVTNRAELAEPHLRKVAEITKSASAAFILADYYIARNADSSAIAVLEQFRADPKTASDAGVRLAALDQKRGRIGEAHARLDGVLSKDKTHLAALVQKIGLLLADGKSDQALQLADVAVTSHKDSATAFFIMGRVQETRRQGDEAMKAYAQVLRLNPRATSTRVALARLHLIQGQADRAVQVAEEATRNDPKDVQAKLLLIQGLLTGGQLQRAEAELVPLIKAFPDSATVQTRMGMLRVAQSSFTEARKHLDRATSLAPNSLEALSGQIALDLSLKQYEDARHRIDRRLQQSGAPPVLMLAARTYMAIGDDKSAEDVLRRALKVDSRLTQAYGALAQIYMRQRRLDSAEAEFTALAELDPTPVGALTMVGTLQQMRGDTKSARAQYKRVLDLDANASVAANNLAWIYATEGGDLDAALDLARSAKRGLPDAADVGDTVGFIYYKKGLHDLAINAFEESIAKDGNNPTYHFHLGLASAKAGYAPQARQHLSMALKLNPAFDGAAEAKRVLGSLW